ncbi:heat shock factor binding protein 1-domain-containing protein [Mycena rebaudengoi]|nr:heat shock factor binding protein 1-domain-containing protein [Mycena rebaudengoi]
MASSALPLKVTPSTPAKVSENERDKTPTPAAKPAPKAIIGPSDISSPHELTAFVETLLEQLDTKFDEMSTQILDRMTQMSTRVDALEASIQDIINGDVSVPQSPSPIPGTPGGIRRSGSEL